MPSAVIKCINLHLKISHGSPTGAEELKKEWSSDSPPILEQVAGRQHTNHNSQLKANSRAQELKTESMEMHAPNNEFEPIEATCALVSPIPRVPTNLNNRPYSQAFLSGLTHHSEPMPQLPSPPQLINFAQLKKFLDCSLKGMMFNSQRAVPAGDLLSSTAYSTKTLDQISPAVFSPGYLQVLDLCNDERKKEV